MEFKTFKMFEEQSLILDTKEKVKERLVSMKIENYTINDDLTVDVDGNVDLSGKMFQNFPVKFVKVNGSFKCSNCPNLVSLKGVPKEVSGSFYCSNCPNLVSLNGAPKEVSGSFWCYNCPKLVSLEGAPKTVGGSFWCYNCPKLVSLEGAPKTVGGGFYCSDCESLVSFINFPKVNGRLCYSNTPFKNLFNDTNFKDFVKMNEHERENFIIKAFKEGRINERLFVSNVSKERQLTYKGLVSGKKFGL